MKARYVGRVKAGEKQRFKGSLAAESLPVLRELAGNLLKHRDIVATERNNKTISATLHVESGCSLA